MKTNGKDVIVDWSSLHLNLVEKKQCITCGHKPHKAEQCPMAYMDTGELCECPAGEAKVEQEVRDYL